MHDCVLREARYMPTRIALHGPIRLVIGVTLLVIAVGMIIWSEDVGWGVSATTIVPAICLMVPALSCLKRKVILIYEEHLEIEVGWMWRRSHELRLQDMRIEIAPMAGLWALIVHQGTRRWPLALWSTRGKVSQLQAALDERAPDAKWPRVEHQRAEWDR